MLGNCLKKKKKKQSKNILEYQILKSPNIGTDLKNPIVVRLAASDISYALDLDILHSIG